MVSAEKMLQELGVRAKKASRELNGLGVKRKNEGLEAVAKALFFQNYIQNPAQLFYIRIKSLLQTRKM